MRKKGWDEVIHTFFSGDFFGLGLGVWRFPRTAILCGDDVGFSLRVRVATNQSCHYGGLNEYKHTPTFPQ